MLINRWLTVSLTAAALAFAASSEASAQGVEECYDGTTWKEVGSGAGKIARVDCQSSVNRVFRNQMSLGQLVTIGEQIKAAVMNCGLPNGPYRRKDLAGVAGADPRLDYVTVVKNNTTGTLTTGTQNSATVSTQLGITPGFELSAEFSGSSSQNSGIFTIKDVTGQTSQILDVPGFEWVLFLKSSGGGGGQTGTLLCDINMFYNLATPVFGIQNFPINHGVNEIVVGWAAGPSPFGNQLAVDSACNAINPGLTVESIDPGPNDTTAVREAFTPMLLGFYETLPGDLEAPLNGTSCSATRPSPVAADFARYCDQTELAGRANACNSGGPSVAGVGGHISGVAIGVVGEGTLCLSTSSTGSLRLRC